MTKQQILAMAVTNYPDVLAALIEMLRQYAATLGLLAPGFLEQVAVPNGVDVTITGTPIYRAVVKRRGNVFNSRKALGEAVQPKPKALKAYDDGSFNPVASSFRCFRRSDASDGSGDQFLKPLKGGCFFAQKSNRFRVCTQYVWGGTNPSTSFDCSGYVSWVIDHSGWNYGRLGVMGLEDVCTPVSRANAKPGDLVFFIGTYDAPYPDRPSHVGIYVGNGMMIHCGSPISCANINTPYWQNHFYGFGRLRGP